jgi:hypothetical protein
MLTLIEGMYISVTIQDLCLSSDHCIVFGGVPLMRERDPPHAYRYRIETSIINNRRDDAVRCEVDASLLPQRKKMAFLNAKIKQDAH